MFISGIMQRARVSITHDAMRDATVPQWSTKLKGPHSVRDKKRGGQRDRHTDETAGRQRQREW